jgi:hypothetical protein
MEIQDLKLRFDKADFPMVEIPASTPSKTFYMQWLPVTKIQLEYFLSDVGDSRFDSNWYESLLKFNERVAPGAAQMNNYWQLFATGILPIEARRFAQWCGRGFDLPTAEEWLMAWNYLSSIPASPDMVEYLTSQSKLRDRTKRLLNKLESILTESTTSERMMIDQSLMRYGVMEYVYENNQRNSFAGFGQPSKLFFGTTFSPAKGIAQLLANKTEGARMKQFGFRLIWRG